MDWRLIRARFMLLLLGLISSIFLIFWIQHDYNTIFKGNNFKPASIRRLAPRNRRRNDQAPSETVDDIPRNMMGFLCQDNPLVEELGTRCKTISRSIGRLGCDRKIVDLASERNRDIESIPMAFRQARVADACPESCGLCTSKD